MRRPIFSSMASKKRVFTSINLEEFPFSASLSTTFKSTLCLCVRVLIYCTVFSYYLIIPINNLLHIGSASDVKVFLLHKIKPQYKALPSFRLAAVAGAGDAAAPVEARGEEGLCFDERGRRRLAWAPTAKDAKFAKIENHL